MRGLGKLPVAAVAAGAMTLALAGCWPAPGQGPDRQSNNPFESTITVDSVASLDDVWTVDTGDAPAGAPIVSQHGVHVRGGSVLHTLARSDGHQLWQFDGTQPAPTAMSDPIWQDGKVYVGYGFGNLGGHWQGQVLDGATGASAGTAHGGLVDGIRGSAGAFSSFGFGSGTPIVVGIAVVPDLADSSSGWSGTVYVNSGVGGQGPIQATVGTAGVYHAGPGPTSTTPSSSPPLGNGLRMFGFERPTPCYTGGSPFVPCPVWATPLDGGTSVSPVIGPGEDTIYTGTDAGTVYAVDAATGAVRWSAPAGAGVVASPALAGGTLFVPTADGDLVALDAVTGDVLWSAATGAGQTVQPAVAGGVVFTGSSDGSLHAFAAAGCGAATCPALWSESTGSSITGAPAVSGGRLYVGTQDGRVVSYAPA
jgi:outer membrane protein assembly factor BamB